VLTRAFLMQASARGQEIQLGRLYVWLTLLASLLVLISSLLGILVGSTYAREASDWALQARAQDVVDILAVASILAAIILVKRSPVKAFGVWVGGLLFLVYAYFIFAFASHFANLFLLHVIILGLVVYTLLGGVIRIDFDRFREVVSPIGRGTRRSVSAFLLLLAVVFYALWLSEDIPALLSGTVPASLAQDGLLVNPVHVLDIGIYLPAVVITAYSLWKDRGLGYVFALPFLVFSALTGLGILFIDYSTALSGGAVSTGQEVFVGILVVVSVVVGWALARAGAGVKTEGRAL
jgi:hypothetical protein